MDLNRPMTDLERDEAKEQRKTSKDGDGGNFLCASLSWNEEFQTATAEMLVMQIQSCKLTFTCHVCIKYWGIFVEKQSD